jgi:hypothetical protein
MVCFALGFGYLMHHGMDQLMGLGLEVFTPTSTSGTRGKDKHIGSNLDNGAEKEYVPSTCEKYIVDHA